MHKALAGGIGLFMLLSACAGPADRPKANVRSQSSEQPAATTATRTAASGTPGSPGAVATAPAQRRPSGQSASGSNWLKAQVLDDEPWGPGCGVSPHRDRPCRIPFDGVAFLDDDSGSILFEAYEDQAETPVTVRVLPARRGLNRFCTDASCAVNDARLLYTASSAARVVTFVVVLRDQKARVVAASFPMSFRVL